MAGSIQDTVPKVIKTLWDMENELRSAAQNGVILRGEDARNHLEQARKHLSELLGLTQNADRGEAAAASEIHSSANDPTH